MHTVFVAGIEMEEVAARCRVEVLDPDVGNARSIEPGEVVAYAQGQAPEPLLVAAAHHGVARLMVHVQSRIQRSGDERRVQQSAVVRGHGQHLFVLAVQVQGALDRPEVRPGIGAGEARHRADGLACGRLLRGVVHIRGMQGGDGAGAEAHQHHIHGAGAVDRAAGFQKADGPARILLGPVRRTHDLCRVIGERRAERPRSIEAQPIADGGRGPALARQITAHRVEVAAVPVEEAAAGDQDDQRPLRLLVVHGLKKVQPQLLRGAVVPNARTVEDVHLLLHPEHRLGEGDGAVLREQCRRREHR